MGQFLWNSDPKLFYKNFLVDSVSSNLSCARVRAHTGFWSRAHAKICSAHRLFTKLTWFEEQAKARSFSLISMENCEFWVKQTGKWVDNLFSSSLEIRMNNFCTIQNVMCTCLNLCAHWQQKIRGNTVGGPFLNTLMFCDPTKIQMSKHFTGKSYLSNHSH